MASSSIVARCRCGAPHNESAWRSLALEQSVAHDDRYVEHRRCVCGEPLIAVLPSYHQVQAAAGAYLAGLEAVVKHLRSAQRDSRHDTDEEAETHAACANQAQVKLAEHKAWEAMRDHGGRFLVATLDGLELERQRLEVRLRISEAALKRHKDHHAGECELHAATWAELQEARTRIAELESRLAGKAA